MARDSSCSAPIGRRRLRAGRRRFGPAERPKSVAMNERERSGTLRSIVAPKEGGNGWDELAGRRPSTPAARKDRGAAIRHLRGDRTVAGGGVKRLPAHARPMTPRAPPSPSAPWRTSGRPSRRARVACRWPGHPATAGGTAATTANHAPSGAGCHHLTPTPATRSRAGH